GDRVSLPICFLRSAITIVHFAARTFEGRLEYCIREIRNFLGYLGNRRQSTDVAQIYSQQLATPKAGKKHVRLQLRMGKGKTGEGFQQIIPPADSRLSPLTVEPPEIIRILQQRRGKQGAERNQSQSI